MGLNPSALREVIAVFGRLGATAFGGPAAHVALQEAECVRRRGWLDHQRFLDFLAATNLIPGPNSTEMAIHVGYVRAGWLGLVAGGACFILPAMVITLVTAAAYARYGQLPEAGWILYGVKPVIIAVVVQAMWGLARKAVASLLAAAPGARGVLFDLPEVIARAAGVLEPVAPGRWEAEGGSFFEHVPAGHDRYVLQAIMHDWDDDSCAVILGHIRAAMAPGGRVLVMREVST